MAFLERMAAALAVVGTPVGGVPDIVLAGTRGMVVPTREAGAPEQTIEDLLTDRPKREAISSDAREISRFYQEVA